ncbi:hypothetical protein PR048_022076 [Dryococelus australis]|uniref:Uncharacterized protein n=1 Tax=Dryococelus australis TaxID=614101 RepID=A0ABQ9GZZ6_9NEOP|nr:hypothetical protein PR048_022076 [Dryococelus australis]
MQGRGKREIPEKIRQPAASSGTIPTCENPGVNRPGIEPGSPRWEASRSTAHPMRPTDNPDYKRTSCSMQSRHPEQWEDAAAEQTRWNRPVRRQMQVNLDNVRIWGQDHPHETTEHERASPKVNVFCAVPKDTVFSPSFFHEPTVTGIPYFDMLTEWLFPQLEETAGKFIFQPLVVVTLNIYEDMVNKLHGSTVHLIVNLLDASCDTVIQAVPNFDKRQLQGLGLRIIWFSVGFQLDMSRGRDEKDLGSRRSCTDVFFLLLFSVFSVSLVSDMSGVIADACDKKVGDGDDASPTLPAIPRGSEPAALQRTTMRTGLDFRRGRSRIFACGNSAGRYRWSAGFLEDLPFPPPRYSTLTSVDTCGISPSKGRNSGRDHFEPHDICIFASKAKRTLRARVWNTKEPRENQPVVGSRGGRPVHQSRDYRDLHPSLIIGACRSHRTVYCTETKWRGALERTSCLAVACCGSLPIGWVSELPGVDWRTEFRCVAGVRRWSSQYERLFHMFTPCVRGHGGWVVRLLASHQVELGEIPASSLPDFCKWESCRTMLLAGGFSRGSPVFPASSFRRCLPNTFNSTLRHATILSHSLPTLLGARHSVCPLQDWEKSRSYAGLSKLGLVAYCALHGNIYRIVNGFDICGNICGRKNPPENLKYIMATDKPVELPCYGEDKTAFR